MRPMDADGNFCGKSSGYEDYPYLYYTDIQTPFWLPYGVCVKKCPTSVEEQVECVPTELIKTLGGCNSADYPYTSFNFLKRLCVPIYNDLPDNIKANYDNMVGDIGIDDLQMYARDIANCPYIYLASIFSCLLLIFLYNWMLRCFAEILCWISIIAVGCGLFVLGFCVKDYAQYNYPEGDST